MNTIHQINNEIAIAGQLTPEQLKALAEDGFKSILNLRSFNEATFWKTEPQIAKQCGLEYVNLPVEKDKVDEAIALQVLRQIDQLSKPVLVHCETAAIAIAMVFVYIATRQGVSLSQALSQAEKFGLFDPFAVGSIAPSDEPIEDSLSQPLKVR